MIGSYLAAATSIVVGIFFFSEIPKNLGLYRYLATLRPDLIGLTPAFASPPNYTWEEFYEQDLKGQTAIVTGANSGIGFEIALALAKVRASVTMVCRNTVKCEKARNKLIEKAGMSVKVETMTMDTSSLQSVQTFAKTYIREHGQDHALDMIFMNAGTYYYDPSNTVVDTYVEQGCSIPKTKKDEIEYLFQVNYLGHHLMYRLLQPLVAHSKKPRIIQTSATFSFHSYSHKVATKMEELYSCQSYFPFSDVINSEIQNVLSYGQSKLAQIVWTKALARKYPHILANSFHPGLVNTPMIGKILDFQNAGNLLHQLKAAILPSSAWQPSDAALTGLYLASAHNHRGKYFHPQAQEVVNPLALDEQLQDDLWDFSNELVQYYLPKPAKNERESVES